MAMHKILQCGTNKLIYLKERYSVVFWMPGDVDLLVMLFEDVGSALLKLGFDTCNNLVTL